MSKDKLITDFEDLFERFCIMSDQQDIGESKALQILRTKTSQSLFNQLQIKLYEIDRKKNKI